MPFTGFFYFYLYLILNSERHCVNALYGLFLFLRSDEPAASTDALCQCPLRAFFIFTVNI